MAHHKKLREVVKSELKEIKQRREKAHASQDDVESNLVGLALSGGALRSANFSLGFVQALQRIGLWKYVDYLSTVSGGGYIGAYLTSGILKDKRPVTKDNQPFQGDCEKQNAQVKRFIYGGHYLLKPLRLANMYLMGLFFINLAIFSGLLALCAAVAFLWRCFDYEYARIWARMLGAGGDLSAPFWPFFLFAFAWLVAWCVSLFQRGGEATGKVARYFLLATFFSFLVGVALLIGNGDIGGWQSVFTGQNVSLGGEVWGPIVALIIGGLLPFLSPKRLLQSGLNPAHDWERYIFKIATTALLVGLPMLLVGWLAKENISGFNTDKYRPLVAGDIQDWPALTGMMVDSELLDLIADPPAKGDGTAKERLQNSGATSEGTPTQLEPRELAFRLALVDVTGEMRRNALRQKIGVQPRESEIETSAVTPEKPSEADSSSDSSSSTDSESSSESAVESGLKKAEEAAEELKARMTAELEDHDLGPINFSDLDAEQREQFFQGLALPAAKRNDAQSEVVSLYTTPYLAYAGAELRKVHITFGKAEAAFLETGQWHRPSVTRYLTRLFDIVSWKFRHTGNAQRYWDQAVSLAEAKRKFALALNEVLRQPSFTESYLQERPAGSVEEDANKPKTGLAALLTRAALTDEDAHSAQGGEQDTTAKEADEWMPHERHELARLLLQHDFPTVFRDRSEIRRVVSINEDQFTRASWFFWSLLVFVIAGMWVDVNSLSLHRYYRNRLAQSFIVPRNVKSPSVPLSDMASTEYGGPYHLINASVGMIRRGIGEEKAFFSREADAADTDQRWVDTFLFSRLHCGSEITGYVDTVAYEHSIQGYTHKIDLAEATAISGAALSPGHVQNWLLAFLMVAMNLSLGQWVPNPRIGKPRSRPRVLALLWSLWKKSAQRPYCFVSDGGHCENLGLVQLLKRHCKLIICVDASCDPKYEFHDLGQAIRTARVHGGVRLLELEPDRDGNDRDLSFKPLAEGASDSEDAQNSQKHFVLGRIRYSDGKEGLLIYVKPSLTGDESADLMQYRNQSHEFPQEPTSDQLFDAAQVEAYRHLGYHIGMELQKLLPRELNVGELWDYRDEVNTELLCKWLTGKGEKVEPTDGETVIANPLTATQQAKEVARPIANKILQKMQQKFESPADIESEAFREMLEHDRGFADVRPVTAVAALQCAVIDRQKQKAEDREFGVWLLRSIEEDDAVPTNTAETLGVLAEATGSSHPERVRLAAIAVLCILGRGVEHREFVEEALAAHRNDRKSSIRLAIRNAISNLTDSPHKPR